MNISMSKFKYMLMNNTQVVLLTSHTFLGRTLTLTNCDHHFDEIRRRVGCQFIEEWVSVCYVEFETAKFLHLRMYKM